MWVFTGPAPHGRSWITCCFYCAFMDAHGRNMDEHGWMNRGSPLYSNIYMDDGNCFPNFDPLFLARRTSQDHQFPLSNPEEKHVQTDQHRHFEQDFHAEKHFKAIRKKQGKSIRTEFSEPTRSEIGVPSPTLPYRQVYSCCRSADNDK